MLDFGDRTRTGIFNVVWPLSREEGRNKASDPAEEGDGLKWPVAEAAHL